MEDQNKEPLQEGENATPETTPAAEPAPAEVAMPVEPAPAPEPAATPAPEPAPAATPAVDDKMTNNVSVTKAAPVPAAAPAEPAAPQQPGAQAPGAAAPYTVGAAGAQQPAGGPAPQQPASPYAAAQPPYGAPAQPGAPASPYGAVPPVAAAPSGSGKATGALVCGILAILMCAAPLIGIVLGIVAIVLGGSYLKTFGADGKAKAGRICGIVGIVLSVLLWVFAIGTVMWAYSQIDSTPTVNRSSTSTQAPGSSSTDRNSSSAGSSASVYDENEQAVLDLVTSQFDALEDGDAAVMQTVASIAAEGFEGATGVPMEACGIDPINYARLMTENLSYEVDLVVVNGKQGTGWVSVDVTCRDIFAVLDLFNDKVDEFDASGAANSMTEEQVQQKLGELLMAAVTETTSTTEDYATINCTLENGTWVMNEDDWMTELDYLFGLV